MNFRSFAVLFMVFSLPFFTGCNTAFMVGDRVVGVHSGKFFYTDGALKTDYNVTFERAWNASEQTLADMNATIKEIEKKISKGTFDAVIDGEDVRIAVEYLQHEVTMVSVRVGLTGNNLASKLIHDKIREHLSGART